MSRWSRLRPLRLPSGERFRLARWLTPWRLLCPKEPLDLYLKTFF